MATNVRAFNGTSDSITLSRGAFPLSAAGALSALVVATVTNVGTGGVFFVVYDGTHYWQFYVNSNIFRTYDNASTGPGNATTVLINKWYVCGFSKPSGNVAPRFHFINLTDSGAWTHETAGSGTLGGGTATSGPSVYLGMRGSSSFLPGSMFCAAMWNSELSDATFATFGSLAAIIAASPAGLLILNQAVTTDPVNDYTSGGANQTAISGTTVTSGVTIPNFDPTVPTGSAPTLGLLGVGV